MELKKTEVSPLKLARANVSSASECEMFPMKIKTDKRLLEESNRS